MKIKITTVGNSAGIILPEGAAGTAALGKGDALYASELPDGIKLTPYDPKLAGQMEVAERIMRKDRNVLRKLAESRAGAMIARNHGAASASRAADPSAFGFGRMKSS